MKRIILILIMMLSIFIYSQESKENNWAIKINAIQLSDFASFPTLQLSVERKIKFSFIQDKE